MRHSVFHFIVWSAAISVIMCACSVSSARKVTSLGTERADECPIDVPYKSWFFNQPSNTTIGYPHEGTSAFKDAVSRYVGYREMRANGFYRQYNEGAYFNEQDSIYFYYLEPDSSIANSLHIIDSFFICCSHYVYLVSSDSPAVDTSNVLACEAENTSSEPAGEDIIIGSGTARMQHYNQAAAWIEAEQAAVKRLCERSVFEISSLQKYHSSGKSFTHKEATKVSYDLMIRSISIVSRTFNPTDFTCTVVVMCRKSDIAPYKE